MADVPNDFTGAAPKRPALRPFSGHSRDAGQGPSRPLVAGRAVVAPFAVRPHQSVRPTPTVASRAAVPIVAPLMIERTPMRDYSSDLAAAIATSETLPVAEAAVRTERESATAGRARTPELERDSLTDGVARRSSDDVTDDTTSAAPPLATTWAAPLASTWAAPLDTTSAAPLDTAQSTLQPSSEAVAFTAALDTSSLDTSSLDSAEDDVTISDIDAITYGSTAVHEHTDITPVVELDDESLEAPMRDSGLLEFVPEVEAYAVSDALVIAVDLVSIPAAADVQGKAFAPPTAVEPHDLLDDALADFQLQAGEWVEVPHPIPGPDLTLRDDAAAHAAHAAPVKLSADESVNDEGNSGNIALTVDQTASLTATVAGTVAPTTLTATLAGARKIALVPPVDAGSSESDLLPLNAEMPAVDEELRAFVARAHVVEMLQVVARRVQAGEIVVVVDANASPEAVLARVLASLLSP